MRSLSGGFGLCIAVAALFLSGCATYQTTDGGMLIGDRLYPGQMVDVGGFDLFFSCMGKGDHTVVLIPGGGAVALVWKDFQEQMAADHRLTVCSYDRPGLGWSEHPPQGYSVDHEVAALRAGIGALGLHGPTILVAPSYGAFVANLYGGRYPDVQGIVYADPVSSHFFDRHPEVVDDMHSAGSLPWWLGLAPSFLMRWVARSQTSAVLDCGIDRQALADLMVSKSHLRGQARVGAVFGETVQRLRDSSNPLVPTIVISRGLRDESHPWTTGEREHDWRHGHETLIRGVPNARLWVAKKSRHMISVDQPDLLHKAILTLLDSGG